MWLVPFVFAVALFSILVYMPRKYRTSDEAKQRIAKNNYDVIIDVRTPEEWNQGHYPNAVSIPIGEFITKLPATVPDKNARILIVCRKGIRSKAAAQMANDLGYTNVEWVTGLHNGLAK